MARYLIGDAQTYSAKWDITFDVDIIVTNIIPVPDRFGKDQGSSAWTAVVSWASAIAYGGSPPQTFEIFAGEKTIVAPGEYPLEKVQGTEKYRNSKGQVEIKLNYRLIDGRFPSLGTLSGYFVLKTLPDPQGDLILGAIPPQYYRVKGTVKAQVSLSTPFLEYVDINEHYPLDGPYEYDNCGSEFYIPADLTEETVRQWPKYTTIDWFELLDTRKNAKCSMSIYAEFKDKDGTKTYGANKTYPAWPPNFNLSNASLNFRPTYQVSRNIEAHASGDASNNGSIYVSYAGTELSGGQNKSISIPGVSCDTFSYSIIGNGVRGRFFGEQSSRRAQIMMSTRPTRTVTWHSQIKDWKNNHQDEATVYLAGFNSNGKTFADDPTQIKCSDADDVRNLKFEAIPSFATIKTKDGNVSSSQKYSFELGTISIQDFGPIPASKSDSVKFNNFQRWIFGMIDGTTYGEYLDDLISPSKNEEYPAKYAKIFGACGKDVNCFPRSLVLDENDLPSGSMSIPIALRGWKFNALDLSQKERYTISGQGNSRVYEGTETNPNKYGDLNFSGYRYLELIAKSKNSTDSNFKFSITETSKGPVSSSNGREDFVNNAGFFNDVKSWDLSVPNTDTTFIIDLCNPDNKTDNVDDQDSPYPRLNTYTTSKANKSTVFGYLAKENLPKDTKLVTKKSLTSTGKWIDDAIKNEIQIASTIYIYDPVSGIVDYFDVDAQKFESGITDTIYGKSRLRNGLLKFSRTWSGSEAVNDEDTDYRKSIFVKITKNDLTKNKTIDQVIDLKSEIKIIDYDEGYPDITEKVASVTSKFVDGDVFINVTPIAFYENPEIKNPYTHVVLDNGTQKKYQILSYEKDQTVIPNTIRLRILQSIPGDPNIIFQTGTTVKLAFEDGYTDDETRTFIIKLNDTNPYVKLNSTEYKLNIEYAKRDANSTADYNGIPRLSSNASSYTTFSNDSALVNTNSVVYDFVFPIDSQLSFTYGAVTNQGQNEVNAIDDYPDDEVSNGPYYGITRARKLEIDNDNVELGTTTLKRFNSKSNFIIAGDKNSFEYKTKFIVAKNENSDKGPTITTYYTRRFWQQNTDGRDEEEGDITWQKTPITTSLGRKDNWTLYPKSIADFCDDVNAIDTYVISRDVNNGVNNSGDVVRHPGWKATKTNKTYLTDPYTGARIYTNKLDPEYLNSDTGFATWIYGGGLLCLPDADGPSGTSFNYAFDLDLNNTRKLIAQTIFHRINGNFPPGRADLFGNSAMKVSDDAVQKSVLHLRGGTISRGPGHGLILPPKLSTPEDLRQANLIRASDNFNAGSDETDSIGYYETSRPYGNNNLDHFIKLEPTEKVDNSDKNKSSSRKISQAKRERASFKPGIEKKVAVTSVSVVETGFEHSLLFAYNVPSKTPFETVVISTDSFFDPFYEKNPVGFKVSSGTGQTIKGAYPFLLSSELKRNKLLIPHSFVLTEFDTASTYGKSSSYKSIIGANLNFRDKDTWYPFQGGNVDTKLDFNKYTTIFEKTKFNSFCLSDYSPQIYTVGYADPGALILQTTHLTMSNINSPNTDKVLHIDGKVPTDVAQFRLFEPITTVGTASTAFASVCQIKSNELIVSYSLEEEPRKIFYRIVSNNQVQAKNLLLDLDDLSGNVLNASYNVYGINSFYDKMSNIHKTTFMSNGNIYYHEFDINGSITGNTKTTLIHLIKGDLNDKLASALNNKQLLHKYFDSTSGFASTIPIQRPGITACQKQSYASHTIIAYQTGKCKIEAVLFKPFKDTFVSSREFDIECPNETPGGTTGGGTGGDTGGGTGGDTGGGGTGGDTGGDTGGGTTGGGGGGNNDTSKPNAKFSASPTSGTKDLTVTFTNQSTPFNDLSALSKFKWDFYGDGSDLLETTTLDSFTYVYTRVGTFNPKLIAVDINNIESDVYNLVTITVNDIVNQPPTADFTFQQNTFVSPFSVAFSDTSKDIDGTITSWNWSFGDGNTSTLQNPTNDYQLQGTYNVKLIVTDNLGLSAEISRSVTVAPLPNKPPIPDFTYSQRLNTFTIDFVNNSSDPENDALSYEWTLNEFDTNSKSSLKDPSYTYQVSGIYNVTLKVIDSNSNSATITKQVQVNDVNNLAPNIIDVSYSQTSYVPLTIKFSENSTDTDGYVEQWEWNFGDGSSSVITDPTLKNTTHIYANPGRYIVTLAVTDNGLPIGINKKTTSRTITVIVAPPPPNIPPVASFTVDKNNLPAIFTSTFTDQSTDSDGTIVSWLWELPNNQNIIFDTTNYSKTVLYTFTKSGTYTIKLTVTDNKGTSSTATQDIIVVNQNPSALLTASPNPILSKNTITLDASGSNDIDGNIVNYSWDFGDGVKKLFGSSIENYVYNFPGSYVASVTVTDNLGLQNTALVDIVVQNRNPVAVITYDFLTVKAPNSLNFSGTSSYDEDGRIVRYSWIIINKSLNITYFSSVSSAISVPFTTQGLYTVTLTVTDNLGATNSTSLDVTVTPADNIPPVAVLNVDKLSGTINDTFSFNFRGSNDPDANGSIIRYIINYGDGVEETYSYAPLLVTHRYALPGVYVAKLVVIDNRFGRSLETIDSTKTITINNEPPVANFSVNPTTVFTFENVSLTDLSTDAENSIVKWTWNFGDGSPDLIITDPLLANQTKQYSKGGVDYIITLTVEDNFGLTNTTYKTVTVLNRKPIALIKTDPLAVNNIVTVEQGTTITFTSDSYDLDGIITRYEWYIVGITSAPITTKNFYRSFAARDALYEVTLRVMDDQNLWSDTVSVFVKVQAPNTPPVVYLNANPPSGTATAPVTVFFDSNGTFDPDNPNELLVYFWDFGNGSFSSSPSSSTTYTKAGSYNVFLDVTDRRGSTTQRTLLYVVKDATTGDTTTGGTTSGNLTTGDTTTGGTTTGSTTTGGTTTGDSTTGGNINNTPTAPPADTTPPAPVTNPPIIITGPPANTTPPTTTITTPPTIDWFANPANQVPPASGPIVDPNIQGAE